jgi:hypothetical protein
MRVKFGKGTKDVPVRDVTAENYIVPKGEEGSYHVKQEVKTFNARTGERLSKPRMQKYGAKEFKQIERILRQQGYEIEVLYDPTEWLNQQAEARAEREALTARQQHDRKVAQREAEKAAMKAEIIAELKAAGVIPNGENTENGNTAKGRGK